MAKIVCFRIKGKDLDYALVNDKSDLARAVGEIYLRRYGRHWEGLEKIEVAELGQFTTVPKGEVWGKVGKEVPLGFKTMKIEDKPIWFHSQKLDSCWDAKTLHAYPTKEETSACGEYKNQSYNYHKYEPYAWTNKLWNSMMCTKCAKKIGIKGV